MTPVEGPLGPSVVFNLAVNIYDYDTQLQDLQVVCIRHAHPLLEFVLSIQCCSSDQIDPIGQEHVVGKQISVCVYD